MLNIEKITNTPYINKTQQMQTFKANLENEDQSLMMTNPVAMDEFIKANKDVIEFGNAEQGIFSSLNQIFIKAGQFIAGKSKPDVILDTFLRNLAASKSVLI